MTPIDDLPDELIPPDKQNDPMQMTSMKQMAQVLEALLKKLPEKEKLVMALHYQEELSFRDVATVLNLTPGRVSQLHTQAMIRIRAGMKKDA